MKNFYSYLDHDGNAHTMNLNGYAVQLSQLDQTDRERFIYNAFVERARRVAKYYCVKHDMGELDAVLFIASGLYAKFMDIRDRAIKRADGVHYNGVEYCAMLKTFSQLRYALDRANCKPTTAYSQTYVAPRVAVSFDNGRELVIPEHTVKGKLDRPDMTFNSKMFDIIDVIEMWDNRASRKRARFMEAVNALNDDADEKTVKLSLNENEMSADDLRAVRSKMSKLSRDKNDLRRLTELNGVYRDPCADLMHACELERARRMLKADKRYADVMRMVTSADDLSDRDRHTLARFRDRNNLFYNRYDDNGKCISSEPMTRDELVYLLG